MSMQFVPIEGSFGVRGPDIDLAVIDDRQFADIKAAVQRHALVLFRRQALTDDGLAALSGRFGRLEIPANHNALSPITPHVVNITNMKDGEGRNIGGGASDELSWHSDQAFRKNPATLSVLYAVIVSPTGGETWWCNTRLGYAALPESLRAEIEGLRGTYLPGKMHTIEKIEVSHPLALPMPDGSGHALYASQSTRGIVGLDPDKARSLLETLLGYQLRPEHIYRHQWRPGDLMIYDNGQTLHRRDAFEGPRFMKGTRAFVSPDEFPVPN